MSSGVAQSATRSFASESDIDFGSSVGLQQLLNVVRATPMSREAYNDLRDAILSFKQTGGAPAAKEQILKQLHEVGVLEAAPATTTSDTQPSEPAVPVINKVPIRVEATPANEPNRPAAATVTPPKPKLASLSKRTGMARPRPGFVAASPQPTTTVQPPVSTAESPTPTPEPSAAEQTAAASPAPAPTPTPADASLAPSQPVEPAIQPAATPVPAAAPSPDVPAEQSAPAATPNPAPEGAVTYANPLERIKEIKKEVNASMGNPVNLIDADNEVGREYMNALLDAMKKINGGQGNDVSAAMARLEAAFIAVKKVVAANPPKKEPVAAATEPTAEPAQKAETVPPPPDSKTPPPPDTTGAAAPVASEEPMSASAPSPSPPAAEVPPVATPPIESEPKQVVPPPPVPAAASDTQEATPSPTPATPGGFASVATESGKLSEQVDDAMKEMKARKAEREAEISQMDPIMVPDVTNGLNQLLSEWKLFKSSGIFGTGPSGAEHPLYKKIANLQMSAVIAGRFEGATPEIKQSITDYMNGWRYEEGILHQHGETFEHYLRRVIKKIIDKR